MHICYRLLQILRFATPRETLNCFYLAIISLPTDIIHTDIIDTVPSFPPAYNKFSYKKEPALNLATS